MTESSRQKILKAIPPVDQILSSPPLARLVGAYPRFPWTELVRATLDDFRNMKNVPEACRPDREGILSWVADAVEARADELRSGGLRRVINATGVVLHTNLGRAVIGEEAARSGYEAMRRYVSLEVDIEAGTRGHRSAALDTMLELATGAESALVVNNNAAAVYLVANTFSTPGRVIISRGELVEIGGSFRLPEILRHATSEVVEVGTTNRTYPSDYAAVARAGDLILKVHKSNYTIEGFAHEAGLAELADLARSRKCYLAYDLGSGSLFDFRSRGMGVDELVSDVVKTGVDGATMSGDKLLGGLQAGIIVGKREFVGRIRQNPLRRAVRVDKVTIAALQSLLRSYLFATDPQQEIPILNQILGSGSDLDRARGLATALAGVTPAAFAVRAELDAGVVGGGSLPAETIASSAVVIECPSDGEAEAVAAALRRCDPPVFSRIKNAEVRLNLATVMRDEEDELVAAVGAALAGR